MKSRFLLGALLSFAAVAACTWNPSAKPDFEHNAELDPIYDDGRIPHITENLQELNGALDGFNYRNSSRIPVRFVNRKVR